MYSVFLICVCFVFGVRFIYMVFYVFIEIRFWKVLCLSVVGWYCLLIEVVLDYVGFGKL